MTDTTNEVTKEGGEAEATTATEQPQNEQPTQTAEAQPEQSTESTTEPAPQDGGADQSTDSATQEPIKFDVPETMNLPDSAIAALTETAQSQGVTGEQAQALLDALAPTLTDANASVIEETKNEWAQAVANDAELGGDKLDENMAIADKAVETFGDEGLKELLNDGDLPLGKEPRLFRMLVRVGRAVSEAKSVNGGITGDGRQPVQGDVFADAARASSIMYPTK